LCVGVSVIFIVLQLNWKRLELYSG
jgi:hypothetical protein